MDPLEKITVLMFWLSFIQIISTQSENSLKKRDGVFTLHPRHIWHGEVRAAQLLEGNFPLCADQWNYADAHEVCRDLGFAEGAMLLGSRTINAEPQTTAVCMFMDEGVYCNINKQHCAKSAWVSCQFPGYIGCYSFNPNDLPFIAYDRLPGNNNRMAIEICTARCRNSGYYYAGLEDGSRCYCGNDPPKSGTGVDRSVCFIPCNDDNRQSCGGIGHISIYESKLGVCNGTYFITGLNAYLASPGFPGSYNPPTQCLWMFITTPFNVSSIDVLGMDFGQSETLQFLSYEVGSTSMTSNETWSTNRESDVRRGVWSVNLAKNTISAGMGIIFNSNLDSAGNRQFLISFTFNNVSIKSHPSYTIVTPASNTITGNSTSSASRHFTTEYLKIVRLFTVTIFFIHRGWH